MTATEIREASTQFQPHEYHTAHGDHCYVLAEAARAYADLLEKGKELTVEAQTQPWPDEHGEPMEDYPVVRSGFIEPARSTLPPGRYLIVRVDDE